MKKQNILIKFISVIRLFCVCFWWRLKAILKWIILLPIDYLITLTTEETWEEAHGISMKAIRKLWNHHLHQK